MEEKHKTRPFLYVFEKIDLSDEIKEAFKDFYVRDVKILESERRLEVHMQSGNNIEEKNIDTLKQRLKKEFPQLDKIEIHVINEKNKEYIKKPSFTQEQYNRAINANLNAYLQNSGYELQKKGHEFCLKEHDSLVINPSNNKWFWHSRGIGGTALQFLMNYENKSIVESVLALCDEGISANNKENITVFKKSEFKLPEANGDNKRVFSYLNKTRKIHPHVINFFIKNKYLYESAKYHNCVFVGRNEKNEPKFASMRGTLTLDKKQPFRGDVDFSDKKYSLSLMNNKASNRVFVFESPIDLMSYMSILELKKLDFKQYNYISLGGLSDTALESFLKRESNIKSIVFCLDNDINSAENHGQCAADKYIEKYSNLGFKCKNHIPILKDFNNDLCAMVDFNDNIENINEDESLDIAF